MGVGGRRGWGSRGRSRISNDIGGVMKERFSVYAGAPVAYRSCFSCANVGQRSSAAAGEESA